MSLAMSAKEGRFTPGVAGNWLADKPAILDNILPMKLYFRYAWKCGGPEPPQAFTNDVSLQLAGHGDLNRCMWYAVAMPTFPDHNAAFTSFWLLPSGVYAVINNFYTEYCLRVARAVKYQLCSDGQVDVATNQHVAFLTKHPSSANTMRALLHVWQDRTSVDTMDFTHLAHHEMSVGFAQLKALMNTVAKDPEFYNLHPRRPFEIHETRAKIPFDELMRMTMSATDSSQQKCVLYPTNMFFVSSAEALKAHLHPIYCEHIQRLFQTMDCDYGSHTILPEAYAGPTSMAPRRIVDESLFALERKELTFLWTKLNSFWYMCRLVLSLLPQAIL